MTPFIPFGDYNVRHVSDIYNSSLRCGHPKCKDKFIRVELMLGICRDGIRLKSICPQCGDRVVYLELDKEGVPCILPPDPAPSETNSPQTEPGF